MAYAQLPDKYPDPMPKPGDIVTAVGHRSDFYGIVTAYGISDTCDSKLWCQFTGLLLLRNTARWQQLHFI